MQSGQKALALRLPRSPPPGRFIKKATIRFGQIAQQFTKNYFGGCFKTTFSCHQPPIQEDPVQRECANLSLGDTERLSGLRSSAYVRWIPSRPSC